MFLRRFISLLLIAVLMVAVAAACGRNLDEQTVSLKPIETCRNVQHSMGETCIPLHPQRVMVLDDNVYLDPVLALGIKPIGIRSCAPDCNERFRGIPDELVAGIEDVIGIEHYPSLEKILLLQPDLILAHVDQNNSQLSAIAPTVPIDYFSVLDFKKRLRYIAQIFGKSSRAEEILSQYNDRIQQLRHALRDEMETKTVALIYYNDLHISPVKPADTIAGQVIHDVGLHFIEAQDNQQDRHPSLSVEVLSEYDADCLFIIRSRKDDDALSFLEKPIWSTLKAVQNNNVYAVEWEVGGTIGANRIINDLYKYLVNTP